MSKKLALSTAFGLFCGFAITQVVPIDNTLANRFQSVSIEEPVVLDIVEKFMDIYREEVGRTSLTPEVAMLLRAERTQPRIELQDLEVDMPQELGVNYIEEEQVNSQQYRIFMLMKYRFQSATFEATRPYVSVLRLHMGCSNTTTPNELACDVIQHLDIPRKNESLKSIPGYIRQAVLSENKVEPKKLYIDAVETQDFYFDEPEKTTQFLVQYAKYRAGPNDGLDCIIAMQHSQNVNSVLYIDSGCIPDASLAATLASIHVTKENFSVIFFTMCLTSLIIAAVLRYRRTRKRNGYSYLHTNKSLAKKIPAPLEQNGEAPVAA